jgi:hypothetical protein
MSIDETALPAEDGQSSVRALTADPAALIQTISSGATDPTSLLMSQLGCLTQDNPGVALLLGLLQRGSAAQAEVKPKEDDEDAQRAAQHAALVRREAARRMRELREMVKDLYAELKVLRERNDTLAAAIGACYLCFGSDPFCEECGGRGLPGSRPSEPAAYRKYVLPAVLRVQKMQLAPARRAVQKSDTADGAMRPDGGTFAVRPEPVQQRPAGRQPARQVTIQDGGIPP